MLRLRFHGMGGQGVKVASRVLGTAAFLEGYKEVCVEFERAFGRNYDTIEGYMLEDAEYVLVMANSFPPSERLL